MGFELTPRERRWLDAGLALAVIALTFVVLGFLARVLVDFGDLILVFFLAWLLAFIISPLVARLRATIPFLSRAGAIFVVYLLIFGTLVVLSILVATALAGSITDFIASVPGLRQDLPNILAPWQRRLDDLGFVQVNLLAQANDFLDNLNRYAAQLAAPLQQIAVASLGAIGNVLLIVVLSLYMVADRDRLVRSGFRLVPKQYSEEARILEESVERSFGGFLRGQAIIGVVYGLITVVVSVVFSLDYIAVTSAVAGLLMAIPFFGPFLAWAPPVLVAIFLKPDAIVGTVVVMGVGWVIVMNALAPRLMADALRIHPIVVLGSVLVGSKIAGISGAIFGIPVAAVVSAFLLHLLGRTMEPSPVAERAARRVEGREGRAVRIPREPDPAVDADVEPVAVTTPGVNETPPA